ncbi:MAG TPA: hypothetical protein VGN86_00140 [Pyrinomonadaceae bacterium]|nr:hypothetical protein [Pyrinomonadaceae bacterium]
MYCSTCGGAVSRALTYCNHCGAKLTGTSDKEAPRQSNEYPESLIWAIVGSLLGGIGLVIGLMAVMKEVVHFNMGWITGFTILSFLLICVVEIVLIKQLLRYQAQRQENIDPKHLISGPTTKELEPAQPLALPDPILSVTEHTTRAFDPVFSERKQS